MVRTNNSPNGWACRKCRDAYYKNKGEAAREAAEYLNPVDETYAVWEAEQAFCFDF